jgi:hypothetical protein
MELLTLLTPQISWRSPQHSLQSARASELGRLLWITANYKTLWSERVLKSHNQYYKNLPKFLLASKELVSRPLIIMPNQTAGTQDQQALQHKEALYQYFNKQVMQIAQAQERLALLKRFDCIELLKA